MKSLVLPSITGAESPASPAGDSVPAWTFHILTFGCKVNQYESQALREVWRRGQGDIPGGREVDAPELAQVVVINTCAVTANAVSDVRQALRRLHRLIPSARLVVTGCAASAAAEELRLPGVALILGQERKPELNDLRVLLGLERRAADEGTEPGTLATESRATESRGAEGQEPEIGGIESRGAENQKPGTQGTTRLSLIGPASEVVHAPNVASQEAETGRTHEDTPGGRGFPAFAISGFERARPVIKVQDGCSQGCAYCIVPLTRGPSRSRSLVETLAEANRLLKAGYREIMISGINLRQYHAPEQGEIRRDFWGLLGGLVRALAPEWAGRARLRLSSLDPAQLDAAGLDALGEAAHTGLLCPHLHLSLQSGSGKVLRLMGRGHYQPEDVLRAVQALSGIWPRFGLGADMLMGFPGEGAVEARETLDFVEQMPLSYAHVFPYSERPGTVAARLGGQVPRPERQRRAAMLRTRVDRARRTFWEAQCALPELIVAPDGTAHGRGVDAFYVPCRFDVFPEESGHDFVRVRPLRVEARGIVVEPLLP